MTLLAEVAAAQELSDPTAQAERVALAEQGQTCRPSSEARRFTREREVAVADRPAELEALRSVALAADQPPLDQPRQLIQLPAEVAEVSLLAEHQ